MEQRKRERKKKGRFSVASGGAEVAAEAKRSERMRHCGMRGQRPTCSKVKPSYLYIFPCILYIYIYLRWRRGTSCIRLRIIRTRTAPTTATRLFISRDLTRCTSERPIKLAFISLILFFIAFSFNCKSCYYFVVNDSMKVKIFKIAR